MKRLNLKDLPDYPKETKGSKLARFAREKANKLRKKRPKPKRRTVSSMRFDIIRLDQVIVELQYQIKKLEEKNIELSATVERFKSSQYSLELDLKNSESIRERLMNTTALHVRWISKFYAYLRKSGKSTELRDLAKEFLNQDSSTFSPIPKP